MGFVQGKVADHGSVFKCRIMNQSTIVVASHAVAAEVLGGSSAGAFSLSQGYSQFMDGIFGENVLLSDGPTHQRLAGVLHEVMGPDAVAAGQFERRIAAVVADVEVFFTKRVACCDKPLDLYEALKEAATRASLSLCLGVDVLDDVAVAHLTELTRTHWHGIISVPLQLRIPGTSFMQSRRSAAAGAADALRTLIGARYDEAAAVAVAAGGVGDGAAAGEAAEGGGVVDGGAGGGGAGGSVFDSLRQVLDRDESIEQALLFISALVPKAIAALMTQLLLALDGPSGGGGGQTLKEAARGDDNVLAMVLAEVERCYPPFFACLRVCTETTEIGGHTFPKGYRVMVVVPLCNGDPAAFRDGDRFSPSRWAARDSSTAATASTADTPGGADGGALVDGEDVAPQAVPAAAAAAAADGAAPPGAAGAGPVPMANDLFTYGGGPRACIGRHLMRPLLRGLASMIVTKFEWKIAAADTRKLKWLPTMRPVAPVETTFWPRAAGGPLPAQPKAVGADRDGAHGPLRYPRTSIE